MSSQSKQLAHLLKKLQNLDTRLLQVEKTLASNSLLERFTDKPEAKPSKGLQAGILLLIENGFFTKQRTATEAKAELDREAYFYSNDTISKALSRDFTKKKQILTRVKNENGVWVYAVRK